MKKILCAIIILAPLFTNAQQVDLSKSFKNLQPRAIGPSGMSGRITTIDALHTNPNTIYIGAASGGVWKTENAGGNWKPLFDEQPIQNIGSVAICQSNPSIIWVGTGEGNPRNSVSLGEGIYKSIDAGKTWKLMGLEKTRNIHRIIIDPNNPDVVYAGAIGNPYGVHPERGVFKTTNGGDSWTKVLHTNDTSGVSDMVMDPKNPNKMLVGMWQHSRSPWNLSSGGKGSGLFLTLDAGKTWKNLAGRNGLPSMPYGRIGVTMCYDMPNRIYALIESKKSALYRTDDGGENWEKINEDPAYTANRSFYFQDIFCDPKNENRVWLINQIVSMSEDGGKAFKTVIPYNGIHPDHHAFWINPLDPSFIIDGNDGGIGITRDKGKTWLFDEKLPVGQFYHINVDNELPYNVMGGMQDNGSWRGPAYTWTSGGLKNYYWESLWGGDGFDVMPDAEDASWVYAMSQGGGVGRYNVTTGESWNIKPPSVVNFKDTARLRFNWNAAIAQDPFDKKTIYYGSQFVHKSTDKGASWTTISPDLTTNDSAKIDQTKNGGISIDITGAENYCTILAIEPSKLTRDLIWATTDDGQVQLTRDGGKSWSNVTPTIKGFNKGAWLPQVKASRYIAGEAFVVANDYRRGNFDAMIFRTKDYGKTWENILQNKKTKGYALCIIQDPVEPNLIFVGTEQGLWISLDNAASFQQFKNEYPSVSTYDLAIQEREADLCIATFGRALYILDDIRPLRVLAANKGKLDKKIMLMPNNDAYQVSYKNAPGYEWSTWGIWDADNKGRAASINLYIDSSIMIKKKPVEKGKEDNQDLEQVDSLTKTKNNDVAATNATTNKKEITAKGKEDARLLGGKKVKDSSDIEIGDPNFIELKKFRDTADVKIYDASNELIRTLKWTVDTGFNRKTWGLEAKGERQPGSAKPKKDAAEPGGFSVLPGRYKVVVSLHDFKDSNYVQVKADPRVADNSEIKKAQMAMLQTLSTSADKLTEGYDMLADAEEIAKKFQAQFKGIEGKAADSIRKRSKTIQEDMTKIRDFVEGKKIERQGYGQIPVETVLTSYREARSNIMGKNVIPGIQEQALVTKATLQIDEAVSKINSFFANNWKKYQAFIEESESSIFKVFKAL